LAKRLASPFRGAGANAILAALGVLVCAAALPAEPPSPSAHALGSLASPEGWQSSWKRAGRLMEDKDYKGALAEFLKVANAKDAPDDYRTKANYNCGACHAMLGNKPKALEFVTKAIDLGFDNEDMLATDPQIKAIRGDKKITDAVAKLKAKRVAAGRKEARERIDAFKPGELAFDLVTIDGKPISSKDFAGKVVIVDLWGTWCPPCRAEIPHFIELTKKYKDQPFAMVGLNFEHHLSDKDSPKEAEKKKEEALKAIREFASGARIPYPLALVDQKTMNKLGNVGGFPTTFFLDKSGKLRLRVTGAEDFAPLDSIVAELLAEGAETPASKPAK
jgi:thiol-disulfide isomerase/thioredoxin